MFAHTKQIYEEDCGLAVALTLVKQFKRRTDLISYYVEQLNIPEKNVSLFSLKQLLLQFEIFSEPYEVTNFDKLLTQNFPIIIRTKETNSFHYLVIHKYKSGVFTISDPASEHLEKIPYGDLKKRFSLYALIINSVTNSSKITHIKPQKGHIQSIVFKSITPIQKALLYTLNIFVVIEPLVLTVLIKKLSLINLEVIAIFIILLIIYAINLFSYDLLKLKILNNVIQQLLTKSYISELHNLGAEKKDDDISKYFWNIFNASKGLVNKYFLHYDIFYSIFLIILLALIDFTAAIILFVGVIITGLILFFPIKKLIKANKITIEKSGKWTETFLNTLQAKVDIYAQNKESSVIQFYNTTMVNYLSGCKKRQCYSSEVAIIVDISIFIIIAITMILSNNLIMHKQETIYIMLMAAQGFNSLIHDYTGYLSGKNEIEFITSRIAWTNKKVQNPLLFSDEIKTIMSKNLTICLPNNKQINYPNMYFKQGNSYLLFGPNGVGKSTFIKLLLGINNNFKGQVLINNFKLTDYTYINKISYYSNDLTMFEGTIKENILLSNYDTVTYPKSSINKWNFSIDENFVFHHNNLSNGQKQKVLILRALNKKSDVYIFDEPLSNLDNDSKGEFLKTISTLKKLGKIILIISNEIPDYTFDTTYFLKDIDEK